MMALIVFGLQLYFAPSYLKLKNESNDDYKPGSFIKTAFGNALLWAFAIVAVSVMVSEGAIADWSGLFLRDVAMTPASYVGLGYAGFSVAMTLGRFSGDFLSKKFGAWKVIISGFSLSIAGFLLVLTAHTLTSIAGFLFIGLGFSTIVPEIYRLSSNIKGVDPSSGIAFMAGAGYVGFLAGPVALGAIAEHHGLTISFMVLLGLVSFGTSVAFLIKRTKEDPKNG
ncbi:MAG TPA: MFS transporter [Prolixibacteraceae bacterium]|nr:MFS transporter [Prolixibacteraceae bacterium]